MKPDETPRDIIKELAEPEPIVPEVALGTENEYEQFIGATNAKGQTRCKACGRNFVNIASHVDSAHADMLAAMRPDPVAQEQVSQEAQARAKTYGMAVADLEIRLCQKIFGEDFEVPQIEMMDNGQPGSFYMEEARDAWAAIFAEFIDLDQPASPWIALVMTHAMLAGVNIDAIAGKFKKSDQPQHGKPTPAPNPVSGGKRERKDSTSKTPHKKPKAVDLPRS